MITEETRIRQNHYTVCVSDVQAFKEHLRRLNLDCRRRPRHEPEQAITLRD